MILFKFDSTFDNVVSKESEFDVEWSDLVQLFSTHQVAVEKNTVGFIAAEFDLSATAKPATRKLYDENGDLVTEIVKRDQHNRALPGRYSENVLSIHAICLDSDQGWEIDEAKTLFQGIRHLG